MHPRTLHFKKYATALNWLGERLFRNPLFEKKEQNNFIKRLIQDFQPSYDKQAVQETIEKDVSRTALVFIREGADATREKSYYLAGWTENPADFAQGSFWGGPFAESVVAMDPNYCHVKYASFKFSYINDEEERAGITFLVEEKDPTRWFMSIMKKNESAFKEISVLYSHHFYRKEIDNILFTHSAKPLPTLKKTQTSFNNSLHSKELQKKLQSVFFAVNNTTSVDKKILKEFEKNDLKKFSVDDLRWKHSENFFTREKKAFEFSCFLSGIYIISLLMTFVRWIAHQISHINPFSKKPPEEFKGEAQRAPTLMLS